MMKRGDDVFLFTLIDFLLQIAFFGLLLFVIQQALSSEEEAARSKDDLAKEKLLQSSGLTNLTELTDVLSRMMPMDSLRGTSDYLASRGGLDKVKEDAEATRAAGGASHVHQLSEQLKLVSERLAKVEGYGKPPCLGYTTADGRTQPRSIGKVMVEDSTITLSEPTDDMRDLLSAMNLDFAKVQRLGLAEFRTAFAPVVTRHPECRYFLTMTRRTGLYDPVQTVWTAFRTQ